MNFLNPFALIGMAAAGIPLLLHLLNLRRLRTVEFSTTRFLQELQQTRVRRLKLQQILLLILRTLLIAFAILAFARPTIPGSLPLLASAARASIVILVDNSASMEASDQSGQRFRQAQDAARQVISTLRDGDEVCVLPLSGRNPIRSVGFTRTFEEARSEVGRIVLSESNADIPGTLRLVESLFDEATHPYREVYIISDAQQSTLMRAETDTGIVLKQQPSVFLVRIGNALAGLEQNFSVDSVIVITQLHQPDKPIEIEAFVRNGSDRDASNVVVTMAFDGVRNAQRTSDIPAGETRSVLLSAPPQRDGIIAVSAELEDDAIDLDNNRYVGVMIPPQSRTAVIGTGLASDLVSTALSLPKDVMRGIEPRRFNTVREASSQMQNLDVLYLVNGQWSTADEAQLNQFVQRGGGVVFFASDEQCLASTLGSFGLSVSESVQPNNGSTWRVRNIEERHPLFAGVFKSGRSGQEVVERLALKRMRLPSGGEAIATSDAGSFIVETGFGSGRVLYVSSAIDPAWSTMGATGLFAATIVRASIYLTMPRDQGISGKIGEIVTAQIPSRFSSEQSYIIVDGSQISFTQVPARLPSSTIVTVPAQSKAGIVKILTTDSTAVMPVTINAPVEESRLTFFDDADWKQRLGDMISGQDKIVVTQAGRSLVNTAKEARLGSELMPLFIVLAVLCALAEILVSRFFASEDSTPIPV